MTNEEFIESIKLDNEEWRDVVGYEGDYMVSNLGRIVVLSRIIYRTRKNGMKVKYNMKPHLNSTYTSPSSPYRRTTFIKNGKQDTQLIHRVVAMAFIPNPNNYPCVDHIDDNPSNSVASNLQWCTYKMNNSKEHHRKSSSKSKMGIPSHSRVAVVKLTTDGKFVQIYPSLHHAELEGFSRSAIRKVIQGKYQKHGGYKWMYLSDYEKSLVNQ